MTEARSRLLYLLITLIVSVLVSTTVVLYLTPKIYQITPLVNSYRLKPQPKNELATYSQKLAGSVVRIYRKKEGQLPRIYRDDDLISYGAFITSDGWIISSGIELDAKNLLVFTDSNGSYIPSILIDDKFSGFIFLKIPINNQSVVGLAETNPAPGDQLILMSTPNSSVTFNSALRVFKGKNSHIFNTDYYPYLSSVDALLSEGTPLFDLRADLVGLGVRGSDGLFRSINSIKTRLSPIINDQRPMRTFSISYVDLARWSVEISGALIKRGALIIDDKSGRLKPGEVVLKINDEELSLNRNFSQVLNDAGNVDLAITIINRQGLIKSILLSQDLKSP